MPAPAQTSISAIVAAGRRLLEERGTDALTMRDVAAAVGVRAPSLYKRVRDRTDLLRLILDDVTNELTASLEAVTSDADPAEDLRAMADAYRAFAHANPAAWALLNSAQPIPGATERSVRSSATLLSAVRAVVGEADALPAARTIVPWLYGFISMELAGTFRLGGDIDQAWAFGLNRLITAIRSTA